MNSVAAKVRVAGINPSLPRKRPEVRMLIFQHSLRKLRGSGGKDKSGKTLAKIIDYHLRSSAQKEGSAAMTNS